MNTISESVPSLFVYQDSGEDLENYAEDILDELLKNKPEIEERLEQAERLLEFKVESWELPARWHLELSFKTASHCILVVTCDALESTILEIRKRIKQAGKSRQKFALIKYAEQAQEKWLTSL